MKEKTEVEVGFFLRSGSDRVRTIKAIRHDEAVKKRTRMPQNRGNVGSRAS